MIVNNVAVTLVYALWHITMCAGHVSQLLIITLRLINLFETKYRYTSATLVLTMNRMWIHLAPRDEPSNGVLFCTVTHYIAQILPCSCIPVSYCLDTLPAVYVAYNNAFSMMHHLPTYRSASEMSTVNRVPNCAAVIRNLTFRFMSRLSLSGNALVCSIIDSDLKFVSRIRPNWMNMLYVHFSGG